MSSPSSTPAVSGLSRLWIIVALIVLALVVIGFSTHIFSGSSKNTATNTSQAPDVKALVARVAHHLVVKQDEVPAVAVVRDVQFLQTQNAVFYKDAQVGDDLLLWSDKAVLYSPTRDLILAVVMVNTAPSSTAGTGHAAPVATHETATIEVRNGSGVTGLGRAAATKFKTAGLTVLLPTDAHGTYPHTLIVKSGNTSLPNTLQVLLSITGGQVASLPAGEKAFKGDFLVIVGADFKK